MEKTAIAYGRFDVKKIAESFPPKAGTLLLDTYLTNEVAASSRSSASIGRRHPTTMRLAMNISLSFPARERSGWTTRKTAARSHKASFFFSKKA
jgi:hypothetical protein